MNKINHEFHAILCGTSILLNFARKEKEKAEELGIENWARLDIDDKEQKRAEESAKNKDSIFNALYKALEKDPILYSAELNAFLNYCKNLDSRFIAKIFIYCTDTGTAFLSASMIKEYLESHKSIDPISRMNIEDIRIKRLNGFTKDFNQGLINLLDSLASDIKDLRNRYRICIAATAGFKPEVIYTSIISMLSKADIIYYIHESMRDLIMLPILPLTIDNELLTFLKNTPNAEPLESFKIRLQNTSMEYEASRLKDKGLINITDDRVYIKEWVKKLADINW